MTCRIYASLLILGLLLGIGSPSLMNVARADGEPGSANNGTTTAPTKLAKSIPTEAAIQKLLTAGKYAEAEEAYIQMVAGWHEEKPVLAAKVETLLLTKQYTDGDIEAFLALVRAGDKSALASVRDMLRTGKTTLSPEQMAVAVRALGTYGSFADIDLLKQQFTAKNSAVGNAAVEGLGKIGDTDILPDLLLLAASADINRTLLIARTVTGLGCTSQLLERYQVQLTSPFDYAKKRAAVVLAVAGDDSGWPLVKAVLDAKYKPLYPAALSVLGNLDIPEAQQYVLAGLAGNEAERIAAVQGIDALSFEKIDATLTEMLADNNNSLAVKLAVINQLGLRNTTAARKALHGVAATLTGGDVQLTVAAIYALQRCGALSDNGIRGTIRIQMLNETKQVATAARAALLAYAQRSQRAAL